MPLRIGLLPCCSRRRVATASQKKAGPQSPESPQQRSTLCDTPDRGRPLGASQNQRQTQFGPTPVERLPPFMEIRLQIVPSNQTAALFP